MSRFQTGWWQGTRIVRHKVSGQGQHVVIVVILWQYRQLTVWCLTRFLLYPSTPDSPEPGVQIVIICRR